MQAGLRIIVALPSLFKNPFYKWHCHLRLFFLFFFPIIAYGAEDVVIRESTVKALKQICLGDYITFHDPQTLRERIIRQGLNILIDGNSAKVGYQLTAYERTAIRDQPKNSTTVLFSEHKEFFVTASNMVNIINNNTFIKPDDSRNGNWYVDLLIIYKDTDGTITAIQHNLAVTTSVAKIFHLLAEQSNSLPSNDLTNEQSPLRDLRYPENKDQDEAVDL